MLDHEECPACGKKNCVWDTPEWRREQGHALDPALDPAPATLLPSSAAERKRIPICSGVLDYFTAAIAEVAKVSYIGNEQHNPGEPLHWSRDKSNDHADTLMRHLLERGTKDVDGQLHSAKMVWRALAILELELEAAGAPIARGAKLPEEAK